MNPAANQASNRRTQLELREIKRRAARGMGAKSDRRIRALHRARHGSDERMANDYGGDLRPLAANLQQERADIAVMRMIEFVDRRDFERRLAIAISRRRAKVMMIAVVMMAAVGSCVMMMCVRLD
jgi:hypothetical protein